MNAPKEIVMRLKRAPTRDGAAFIPYIERKDGNLFRQPIPSTKYIRADLVEALVKACGFAFDEVKIINKFGVDITGAVKMNLSKSLKALGE